MYFIHVWIAEGSEFVFGLMHPQVVLFGPSDK